MQSESNFSIMTDEDFAEMEEIPGVKEGRKMRLTAREEMNRVYAANLAAIRTAGELTQVELAKRLGIRNIRRFPRTGSHQNGPLRIGFCCNPGSDPECASQDPTWA